MPPKKRTSTRRRGSTRLEKNGDNSPLPNFSSPEATNPSLPPVPTKHSSAYGSSIAPVLPRQLAPKPKMNLAEMAENIDEGIQAAQDRERESSKDVEEADDEPQVNTRSKTRQRETSKEPSFADDESQMNTRSKARSGAANGPGRRKKREPTPDQAQLLESLREASESPEPPTRKNPSRRSRSTPTPQPPVAHDFSTTGTPAVAVPGNQRLQSGQFLYPSPLDRFGSTRARQQTLGNPQHPSSADNESTISWGVERDIHDDALQRTHPGWHRKNPNGRNITAPPRRPSGLAFQEAIEEEDEPESHPASSPKQSIEHSPQDNQQLDRQQEHEMTSAAPTKSLFHREVRRRMRSEERVGPWMEHMNQSFAPQPKHLRQPQPPQPMPQHHETDSSDWTEILLDISKFIVQLIALVSLVFFIQWSITGYPFGNYPPKFSPNATEMDILNSLNIRVTNLDSRVSTLSQEVRSMRSDVDTVAAARPEYPPLKIVQEEPKINFLTAGMGALVDRDTTSPTFKPQSKWSGYLWGPGPQHPAAAMAPWEDVGDCWCGAPREDGTTRLVVDLGRDVVPEEVVVEHMPKESTINPGVAPKEMEFWARYKRVDQKPAAQRSFWSYIFKQSSTEDSSADETPRRSWRSSLSETMMDLCGRAYRNEPESAYSDNKELPGFYRVGKFTYDQNRPDNVQKFSLDVVLDDPAVRVDKVAFVVKSNWGSENTCLYRLKVHGHL